MELKTIYKLTFPLLTCFSTLLHAGKFEQKNLATIVEEKSDICGPNSQYTKLTGLDCNIKKVRFETQHYSIQEPDDKYPFYGTLAYSGFEADNFEHLQNYGFVQRIRGCTYEVSKNADGTFKKRIAESIMHLGKKRIYVFPDWSADATTTDPLYYGPSEEDSHLEGGRLSLHRWTPKLGVTDKKKTKDLYEILRLPESKKQQLTPAVFVTDTPSMAYQTDTSSNVFQNVSLEFEICLYKLEDIPLKISDESKLEAVPLICHQWNSQYEFNFEKNKYEYLPQKSLDPFCASQIPKHPADVFKEEMENK